MSHHFAAKAIYGLITVLALLLTMEDHPPEAWRGAVTLFGATLAVALLDTYAETIAVMLAQSRRLSRDEVGKIWNDVRPVLVGAQGPTVAFILSAFGFFSVEEAITVAEVMVFVFLFMYGLRVGQKLHEHWFKQLLSGLLVVAIASIIVVIKAVFH